MEQNTTGTQKKSSILEQMKIMEGVVESLDAAGIRIINATASSEPSILLFSADEHLEQWAAENELEITVEKHETENDITDLHWLLATKYNGVVIRTYLSDREKEAWDGESV